MTMSFPELMPDIGELYGTSSARVCEARAFAADIDALDREELAFERTVQALVARKAPAPIGLKFHRVAVLPTAPPVVARSTPLSSRLRTGDDGDDGEEDEEDDDDMEEDEMDEEADEEEEEEEGEDDDAFPLDSDGEDDPDVDDDPFAHEGGASMDLEEEEEEEDEEAAEVAPRRETW